MEPETSLEKENHLPNHHFQVLLLEEILHHLGCIKTLQSVNNEINYLSAG